MAERYVNRVAVRVIVKEDDNRDALISAVQSLFPFDLEKEKVENKETDTKVFDMDLPPIEVYHLVLEKVRHIRAFLDYLFEKIGSDDIQSLYAQRDSRLDDDCNFFIRLDAHDLVEAGIYSVVEHGNCVHIKLSIAAYPAKREVAFPLVTQMLTHYGAQ